MPNKKLVVILFAMFSQAMAQSTKSPSVGHRVIAVVQPEIVSTFGPEKAESYVIEPDGKIRVCPSTPGVKPYVLIEAKGKGEFMQYLPPNQLIRSGADLRYTLSCLIFK